MSTSRDDRYKHSDDSNSTTLGQDGPTDPNGVSTRVEEIESSNSYGGKTIKTTYYRLSGTQQVQSDDEKLPMEKFVIAPIAFTYIGGGEKKMIISQNHGLLIIV
ncbi:hypothetical protein AXG93_1793s1130 [Marchantia polymorpha subsp. ruderalis]|uniref:Uncharacterized protein n=1 Tax=Marchantia polymorpha subsp. ruderalis TaxID=1480154 RepID=A0A176WIK3_MARPO|nr:hypothetical protein AXG93_1793s1130 [Marchantia polymorpha subsp. ruderalis]